MERGLKKAGEDPTLKAKLVSQIAESISRINKIEDLVEDEGQLYDLSVIKINLNEIIPMLKESRFLNSESIDKLYNQVKQLKDKSVASEIKDDLNSFEYEKAILALEKILLEIEK